MTSFSILSNKLDNDKLGEDLYDEEITSKDVIKDDKFTNDNIQSSYGESPSFNVVWESNKQDGPIRSVYAAHADLDGDIRKEIIAGSGGFDNKVYVFEVTDDNIYEKVWDSGNIFKYQVWSVCTGDQDGDGKPEIIVGSIDQNVTVFENAGENTYTRVWYSGMIGQASAMVFDVCVGNQDQDNHNEIIAAVGSEINIFENTSDNAYGIAWDSTSIDGTTVHAICIGDQDGDGKLEIIACTDHKIYVYENTADNMYSQVWTCVSPFSDYIYDVCAGDLDGDGKKEIIAGGTSYIYIFENNGDDSYTKVWETSINHGSTCGHLCIGNDLDGNGRKEIITGTSYEGVLIFEYESDNSYVKVADYPFTLSSVDCVCIGDQDLDGKMEIITGNTDLKVSVLENKWRPEDYHFMMAFIKMFNEVYKRKFKEKFFENFKARFIKKIAEKLGISIEEAKEFLN